MAPDRTAVRIKVCGITSVADAELCVGLGATMLGLNFFAGSMRNVSVERAVEIAAAVAGRVTLVGVFVRERPERVAEIAAAVGLDLLQFHGDEPPAELAPWGARAIKVLRWEGRAPAAKLARDLGAFPDAWGFLLDKKAPGIFGGTGQEWSYGEAADLPTAKPVIVAGGVGPDNVRRVIAEARPWGIDVCSRVERVAGVKDPALLERLFHEAHEARDAQAS